MPNSYFDIVDTDGFGQIEIGLKPAKLFYSKYYKKDCSFGNHLYNTNENKIIPKTKEEFEL